MKTDNFKNDVLQFLNPGGTLYEPKHELKFKKNNDFSIYLNDFIKNPSDIIIGMPFDTGSGNIRGQAFTPFYFRNYLKKHNIIFENLFDLGDIKVIPQLVHDNWINDKIKSRCQKYLYGTSISKDIHSLPVAPLSLLEAFANSFHLFYPDKKIITIGGDHSITYPLLSTLLDSRPEMAIIQFDAHTDLLPSRMGLDLTYGSWASKILPKLSTPSNLIQVGIRDTFQSKSYWQKELSISQFWSQDIHDQGVDHISNLIVDDLKKRSVTNIYITIDIDVIDPQFVTATAVKSPNGILPHEIIILINKLKNSFNLLGADICEINPLIGNHSDEPNNSFKLLTSFINLLRS